MTTVPRPIVWLTRDSFEGTLEPMIDVWELRPWRQFHRGDDLESLGVTWFDHSVTGIAFRSERMSASAARVKFGTIPDDDMQCIRIGS